ncbi:membrane-bound PQQ-dependent dehydrogenase, glucose/quinate/shikimate family [Sodalis sp. (in: enterobacteria)]|uniref:membrane-bound PQQ-dependent dehydrogenase, glucose/quinate/shikimate family n=1 Tax=Sodalis sp. (in: enterobacteria) TaxID=1898979 RepID=UPI003F40BE49
MLRRLFSLPGLTGLLICVCGLFFLVVGLWLLSLGGSAYYLPAGILLSVSGFLIIERRILGLWIYLLTFVLTALWALYEVGLDGWKFMPRLLVLAVLGLWCSMPFITRPLTLSRRQRVLAAVAGLFYFLVGAGVIGAGYITSERLYVQHAPLPAAAETETDRTGRNEWRHYGRTPAGERYSPLTQLTPDNVAQIAPAWAIHTGDVMQPGEDKKGREFNFEATPIKVANRLYLCTPHRQVLALNATTGKTLWTYDPHNDTRANEYLACRGVAYYQSPTPTNAPCDRRIISTTADAKLIALDADTGRLCQDFGAGGRVNLTDLMGKVPPGFHFITSQPLVVNDRVVLGGWIYDNQARGEPSGVVRAFDPQSGKLAWAWDIGRSDPTAPLKPGETYTRGTPNGWGTYTADPALGVVYISLGNATPDYYGAQRRPFDDKYSSAIVSLDLATGKERWHFQTVHHDVWDFDLPIGPSLVDLPQPGGGTVPALVQTTKMGQLFLLDRRTGKPLAQVEERPVPQADPFPGERLSPTQPYPTGMPTFAPANLTEKDLWGATPFDQLWCRVQFRRFGYQGQYTPPGLGTRIAYPAFDGVMDWYGASIDSARHVLIANTSYIPFIAEGVTEQKALRRGLMQPWAGWESNQPYPKPKEFAVGPQYGTPYAEIVRPWLSPLGAPCNAPPWGKLATIDLQSRKISWERPVVTTRDMNILNTHTNAALPTGIFTMGGNIITAGGLIFMGATADDYLRAFDEASGKELWRGRLPAGGQATPITYLGADGRQYVVIAAGGHGGLGTRTGDSVVAWALPARRAAGK